MPKRTTLLSLLIGIVGLVYFYRSAILSGGDAIIGDPGDVRFQLVILEHWWNVVRGQAHWMSPKFFYPAEDMLSHSEALLLFAIPYVPLRAFGIEPFTAQQISFACVSAFGFAGMFSLLTHGLRIPWFIAASCAWVFAYSKYNTYYSIQSQMYAVATIPWMMSCAVAYTRRLWSSWPKRMPLVLALVALLSLTAMTSMYVAWFLALYVFIAATAACLLLFLRSGLASPAPTFFEWTRANALHLALSLLAAIVLLSPVAIVYLGRTQPLTDIYWSFVINTIPSPVLAKLGAALVALVIVSFGSCLLETQRQRKDADRRERAIVVPAALGLFICWALMLKSGTSSPWWLVFDNFPGARSIRSVGRFHHVLMAFMVVIAASGLGALLRRGFGAVTVALCCLLVVEQHEASQQSFSKAEYIARRASVPAVPASCRAFLMTFPTTDTRPPAFKHLDAMLVAQRDGVPAVNGYSGRVPVGWRMADITGPEAIPIAKSWLRSTGVEHELCIYSGELKQWLLDR